MIPQAMKTGRLLKFPRPGGDVQAYIYRDGGGFRAALYRLSPGRGSDGDPLHTISEATEDGVEQAVREWVDAHFPRPA